MRRPPLPALALLLLAGCAGAGAGPASERGFFSGIGAWASGEDERGAQRLENAAALEERSAQIAAQNAARAQGEAQRTTAEVQAAQRRLAGLQRTLANQRATLTRLRAERGESGAAEGARLQSELDGLERERRAAAARAGGPSAQDLQQIERRATDLDAALRRFGSI
jgi:hypothetical protein